jgi:HK97 family phage major capsid protein
MKSDSLRETRAQLQGELQQIAEHDGEITSEMADRFESIETQVRELDAQIRSEEVRGRFEGMQAETVTPRMAPGQHLETTSASSDEQMDAYTRWIQTGQIDTRVLNTSDDNAVVPDVLQADLARLMGAVAGAKQAVRVSQLPTRASVPTVATRVAVTGVTAEGGSFTATEPTVSEADFTTDKSATASTELTNQFIREATPDMVAEVSTQHAEEIGRLWSNLIANSLTVDSSVVTDGIMTAHSGINNLDAAAADAITAAELIQLRYETMPAQYWGSYGQMSWVMGQDTFAHIAGLTDATNGRPLMQPFADSTLSAGFGLTLLGLPVHIEAGAPAMTTGNVAVTLIAQNAYRFIERAPGLVQQRDPFTKQAEGKLVLNSYMDAVGRFVRPQACATITMA